MNKIIILLLLNLFLITFSCSENKSSNNTKFIEAKQVTESKESDSNDIFSTQIFPVTSGGYGYNILINGDTIIYQPHIPGVSGKRGFETQEKAKKAADLIIKKIQDNIIPPTVSVGELDSLGLL